ncbi:unnamed protein product, partial [Ilex paraguariensis]
MNQPTSSSSTSDIPFTPRFPVGVRHAVKESLDREILMLHPSHLQWKSWDRDEKEKVAKIKDDSTIPKKRPREEVEPMVEETPLLKRTMKKQAVTPPVKEQGTTSSKKRTEATMESTRNEIKTSLSPQNEDVPLRSLLPSYGKHYKIGARVALNIPPPRYLLARKDDILASSSSLDIVVVAGE